MRNSGILPEAIINVLAALGTANNLDYHDKIDDLISKFSFEKMSLSSPKFNVDDVRQISKKILSEKSHKEIKDKLDMLNFKNDAEAEYFWDTIRENINAMEEAIGWARIFSPQYVIDKFDEHMDRVFLQQMLDTLPNPVDFDAWIANIKQASGKKGRDLFHPIRIVLSGVEIGPNLKRITNILGYNLVKNRIMDYLEHKK
jgi:glutamyl-tRNA synthetase